MSRLQLRASQRRRLEHVLRTTRDAGLFRRVLAIFEVDSGRSIAETARLLRTSRVTVYHWIERFQRTRDPTSLVDHRGGNRPSVWDEELQDVLRARMGHRPEPFGYQAVEWTVPLLGEHLARWCGVRPSASSIRRQLHAPGTFGSDPGTYSTRIPSARKKRQIRREIRQLPPRCVKLFEDETDLLLFPPLRAAWGLRGQPTEVPISGFNAR